MRQPRAKIAAAVKKRWAARGSRFDGDRSLRGAALERVDKTMPRFTAPSIQILHLNNTMTCENYEHLERALVQRRRDNHILYWNLSTHGKWTDEIAEECDALELLRLWQLQSHAREHGCHLVGG